MDVISMDIRLKLIEKGFRNVTIQQQLSPAWTTDWMSEEGKRKLKHFGIAPPNPKQQFCTTDMFMEEAVHARCDSYHTELISQFGSTPAKVCTAVSIVKKPSTILNAIRNKKLKM